MPISTADLKIHSVQPTDSDYQTWLSLRNAIWLDEPLSLAQIKYEDSIWPADFFAQRVIVTVGDAVAAVAHLFENHSQYQPGKYDLELLVHPDYQNQGIGSHLFAYFEQRLAARVPALNSLVSSTREDNSHALAFMQKRGYEVIMRWARSRFDLAAFSVEQFQSTLDHVQSQGIGVYSLSTLIQRDPDWQRKYYEMDLVAGQDAPSPDPMSETPLQKFVQNIFEPPSFMPEGTFVAIHEASSQWLAATELAWFADNKTLRTPFTCVHPDFRRRGIATAIKVNAIAFAQAAGAESIIAVNEENNPMYQINLTLGFQPLPHSLTLKKVY